MLKKLFKYDFRWINRVMPIYYVVLVLVGIAIRIVEYLLNKESSLLLVIADKVLVSVFIGCSVSTMVTCIMRVWGRFVNNLYKDESYLTHTLPVTSNQLFASKVFAGISSLLMSALVIAICVALVSVSKDTIDALKIMWDSLVDMYNNLFAICFVVGIVLLVALEIIYMMMAGILGITVGHRSNNSKALISIVVGIGSYCLLSSVSFVIVYIVSKYIDYNIIGNGFPTTNYIKTMGIASLVIYLVYDLLYYFLARKILSKGVNVE